MPNSGTRPKVVVTRKLPEPIETRMMELFDASLAECDQPMSREQLKVAVSSAHVLSPTVTDKIDADIIEAAGPQLKLIANYGAGVDHIDLEAAHAKGLIVTNTPGVLTEDTADMAMALILAVVRRIGEGQRLVRAQQWEGWAPTGLMGKTVRGKRLGIVGLGRIGALVAERLAGFGVRLIGFDPYVQPARASQMGITLTTLDDLIGQSDFISIHIPKTPETTGMIGLDELKKAKPTLRIVNASRGGIIDEAALHTALSEGWIAGAGIDVFVAEPPKDSPLLSLPNIVVTPHLGASTEEAQEKAGISVARSVRLALEGELVPDAVNVAGGVIDPSVRPGIPLMEKLGQVFVGLCDASITSVHVEIRGEIVEHDVSALKLAALKGIFSRIVSEQVSYVNAPLLAEARGVEVSMSTDPVSDEYRNLLSIRGVLGNGTTVSASATLTGAKQAEKLVEVNGYDIEVPLAEHHIVMMYEDRPGIVAIYGRAFGDANINIAGMQIARDTKGGKALSVLTVDSRVP
ncbi:MAG: phosphoglycerate dehydrogenase, partial [Aquiluna sp.]